MGLHQKIEQKAKTSKWIEDYVAETRNIYRKGDCTLEGLQNILNETWVSEKEVLALVDEDARLRQEKLRKLFDDFPNAYEKGSMPYLPLDSEWHEYFEKVDKWKKKAEKELKQ